MTQTLSEQQPDLRYVKGVGPKRALALQKLGVETIYDLLYYFPRRYEDRSQCRKISELVVGQTATIRGEILKVTLKRLKRLQILEITVGDDSQIIHVLWFNQAYLKNQLSAGQEIILFGKPEIYKKRLQINSPEFEILNQDEESTHAGRITPIYSLTEGLFQKSLRATLKEAVESQLSKTISEFLPLDYRQKNNLMELSDAVSEMHFPTGYEQLERARKRIVHDEFFIFELTLLKKMKRLKEKYSSHLLSKGSALTKQFMESLPFELTPSQHKTIFDLSHDLEQDSPMNRLLQGDVGSGKTVVAAFALLLAAKNNYQSALLVPTEILAEQHYRTLSTLLEPFKVKLGLLTSSTEVNKRERLLAELRNNKLGILIGTHAILQEDVTFSKLAVVVIDEQHKFGVHQRCHLLSQNPRPHQLVMTATPIPRTLALTVFGDLEVSTLKELPKGREPIKTYWIARKKQKEVLKHVLKKIKEGQQAYMIFPLVEETEKSDLLAATREYEKLKKTTFSKIKIGLVHGRISNEERDATMKAFKRGEIKILVSTTVIEVGVDNPNATVMIIENAERFGLSQLHQMRGRIGRGSKASECFLFGEPTTEEGQKRLRILTKTQNGFTIAEEDLKLRGPGDFLGTRQSGAPLFRVANPATDYDILLQTREAALKLIQTREIDDSPDWKPLRDHLNQHEMNY